MYATDSNNTGSPLTDIEFLARSEFRTTALTARAEQPQSRVDLQTLAQTSSSTTGRMLREFESGNLTVLLHEDLPPDGISIFDDRIAISGYNPDSGTVQMLIDTDAPEMREWAESVFESIDAKPDRSLSTLPV